MKRFILAVAIVATAFATSAQPMPQGKWWHRPELVRELQLTPDQQSKLDAAFNAAANDLIDAKANVEKMQIALRAELERPEIRRAQVQQIVARLNDARGRLFAREMMLLVDIRSILREPQWRRLRALDRRPRGRP